jgi:hypothetical protein
MRRNAHGLTTEADWESVSRECPCPICGACRGCSTHSQVFVSCERISSQWPLTTGAWLHRLETAPAASTAAASEGAEHVTEPPLRVALSASLSGTRA